ncbi:ketopantoate reductase family protein [Pseudomonas sp. v388]|uniref:ketopantoate reductase family protein n=1 Tax=Pseudomonas sp. v388 TaxID=2479849 RepID=UPI000F78C60E|nr:ketopantoate reductase family protein [Pseudomonas sp. v388]RRV07344.1 ketopantoate reductase family protein [Pseudomonas sp. v388]
MRILIVGAGATGGYFGGRLLEAGRAVSFLVRPGRAEELERDGLVVRSPMGNFQYPSPPLLLDHQLDVHFDLIVLCCKAYDLEAAIESIAPAVGPQTSILPLLNGLSHLDRLTERFGSEAVLGGQCMISLDRDSTGAILHLNEANQLSFGELSGGLTPRILRVAEALSDAGFEANLSQHILQDMWDKWCFIATCAGVTSTMRSAICDVLDAEGEWLILALMSECVLIATAAGYPPGEQVRQRHLKTLTEPGSKLTASMLRDIERGVGTEVEQILGDLSVRRAALGVMPATPSVLDFACVHLRAYEARRVREQ